MSLTITVAAKLTREARADVLVVPQSPALPATVKKVLQTRDYKGEWGTADLIVAPRGSAVPFLGVVGLGQEQDSARRAEGLRRGLGWVIADARQHALKVVALDLSREKDIEILARAATEAVLLTTYAFTEHKKSLARQQRSRAVRSVILVVGVKHLAAVKRVVREAQHVMEGVQLTRDLVSEPASHMKPKTLVEVAKKIAAERGVSLKIMNRSQAMKDGWRAFLAVAGGSAEEPYVIHLTYKPRKVAGGDHGARPLKKIVLVGKGITFDSGGLSIKPAQSMEDMKIDMAGAATVLGLFSVLSQLQLSCEVHGVIAACENMPSGTAYRPGDIILARSGKTIEVTNTDAEGRVTLADALDYAAELKPDAIIDLATLTGACVVGLGETVAGLFSNKKTLNGALLAAAEVSGEQLEDLPLPLEYKQHIESKVADVRNATDNHPYGGAITAALFLQEFVGKAPWAHLDIAGPAYTDKPLIPYWQYGGTGYGVRTLIEFLKRV